MLAAAVPGIDVIVSGHSHDKLSTPVIVGKTIIVTAGVRTASTWDVWISTVSKSGGAVTGVAVKQYTLLPINDQIAGSAPVQTSIDNGIQLLDAALAPFGADLQEGAGRDRVRPAARALPGVRAGRPDHRRLPGHGGDAAAGRLRR